MAVVRALPKFDVNEDEVILKGTVRSWAELEHVV